MVWENALLNAACMVVASGQKAASGARLTVPDARPMQQFAGSAGGRL